MGKFLVLFCYFRFFIIAIIAITLVVFVSEVSANSSSIILDARIGHPTKDTTRFVLDVSKATNFQIFSLRSPYRIVIDLPNASWALSRKSIPVNKGSISKVRFGRFNKKTSRVVLDLVGPVKIKQAYLTKSRQSSGYNAVIDIRKSNIIDFEEEALQLVNDTLQESRLQPVKREKNGNQQIENNSSNKKIKERPNLLELSEKNQRSQNRTRVVNIPLPPPYRPSQTPRPVIVLDPGHGGADPGATLSSQVYEKTITLGFAKELARQLSEFGYPVYMTRDTDKYISLSDRVNFARAKGAGLFISLHADSHRNSSVRGVAIYTLSDKASDKEAERLAGRENKSYVSKNSNLSIGYDEEVTQILISLIQQRTMNCSANFASTLIPKLAKTSKLLDRTHRFAGFRVLKSPEVPSVLVELGYLTNSKDLSLLRNLTYRQKLAKQFVVAINQFFLRSDC